MERAELQLEGADEHLKVADGHEEVATRQVDKLRGHVDSARGYGKWAALRGGGVDGDGDGDEDCRNVVNEADRCCLFAMLKTRERQRSSVMRTARCKYKVRERDGVLHQANLGTVPTDGGCSRNRTSSHGGKPRCSDRRPCFHPPQFFLANPFVLWHSTRVREEKRRTSPPPNATRPVAGGQGKPSVKTYREDPLFPRVEQAVLATLAKKNFVSPVDVLVHAEVLRASQVEDWRFGRIPYLERVTQGNLSKLSRILRILEFLAHDLKLKPSMTVYVRWGKGPRVPLRFTKTSEPRLEMVYARHFVWPGKTSFHLPEGYRVHQKSSKKAAANREAEARENSAAEPEPSPQSPTMTTASTG